ncbi:BolA family protein [uncultured Brevundimonas sp.]|uniref:BolA family protein n=1 Tax=uncultured Brevundimonas sp. TaxID=213418 RepID=UPI0026248C2E|nr:BolA family protein [uncultured Brevundimonas sp.]
MANGQVAQIIREKLSAALSPQRIELEDDSARHGGHFVHGGVDGTEGGESHFNLVVVSEKFEGLSRIERQRLVQKILADELAGPVHALSIKALSPSD